MNSLPSPEAFEASVEFDPNGGCWFWRWSLDRYGYGRFKFRGRQTTAQRISWLVHHGEIEGKLWVLHTCDVPACVNPDHLFLGTNSDNQRDCVAKGRHAWSAQRPARQAGLTTPVFGTRNGQAKLCARDVEAIRMRSLLGESSRDIGRDFGVHRSTISRIISGEYWSQRYTAEDVERIALAWAVSDLALDPDKHDIRSLRRRIKGADHD